MADAAAFFSTFICVDFPFLAVTENSWQTLPLFFFIHMLICSYARMLVCSYEYRSIGAYDEVVGVHDAQCKDVNLTAYYLYCLTELLFTLLTLFTF